MRTKRDGDKTWCLLTDVSELENRLVFKNRKLEQENRELKDDVLRLLDLIEEVDHIVSRYYLRNSWFNLVKRTRAKYFKENV